jgi:hypothetical protein
MYALSSTTNNGEKNKKIKVFKNVLLTFGKMNFIEPSYLPKTPNSQFN